MSHKNKPHLSTSRIAASSLGFRVTIFFSIAKPSIVVRVELSQRHFIFRERAYVGGCAQFIAPGNSRTGENSQQSRVLLRLLFLVFLSDLCPRVRFSLRSSCAPLHDRKDSSACSKATRESRKRRRTTLPAAFREKERDDDARCPGRELVSTSAIHISRHESTEIDIGAAR